MKAKIIISVLWLFIISNAYAQDCQAFFAVNHADADTLTVNFTDLSFPQDEIISWAWDFGDGTSSTEQDPVHIYENYGEYIATLTIETNNCSSSFSDIVFMAELPNEECFASFGYDISGTDSLSINFYDLSFSSEGIDSWQWDFGDGSSSTEQNPTHSFANDSIYEVSLTINSENCINTFIDGVHVGNDYYYGDECLAMFTFWPSYESSLSYEFFAEPSWVPGNSDESFFWDFGDGETSTELNPIHTFPESGEYTVSLTYSSDECTDTFETTIYAGDDAWYPDYCQSLFRFEPNPENYLHYQFWDFSSVTHTGIKEWLWDFGDETFSTKQNPEHTFSADGSYEVSLTTFNGICENTFTLNIEVNEANLLVDSIMPLFHPEIDGNKVFFRNLTIGNPDWWRWDFGDGTTNETEYSTVHNFDELGIHEVALSSGRKQTNEKKNTYFYNTIVLRIDLDAQKSYQKSINYGYYYPGYTYSSVLENMHGRINIFPNPVEDYLQFTVQNEEVIAEIYDITGRLTLRKKFIQNSGINTLNLKHLNSGMYILKLTNKHSEVKITKFIKQ